MGLTYDEAVKYIYDLPKFTDKHTIDECRELLDKLGAPDEHLKVIHVAGTNGKGSVCVYMESILMHAGIKTGCFVSPHLVDCTERIRINGADCSKEAFLKAFDTVKTLGEEMFMPTFFEFLFLMAMLIFKEEAVDIAILETGLGGRLDATNTVRDKLFSVITSIGYDHCEYLGDTYESIAAEKAGIIMSDRPVIYWEDTPGRSEISRVAKARDSVEIALDKSIIRDIHRNISAIDFCLQYKYDNFICLNIRTTALYQVENASLAVCALVRSGCFDDKLKEDDLIAGIRDMSWPGRMDEIEPGIITDGAHNEPGVRAFLDSVRGDGAATRMLIFGCMRDKDHAKEITMFVSSGLFDVIYVSDIDSDRAAPAFTIAEEFKSAGALNVYKTDAKGAVKLAREAASKTGCMVYITGSLYLIGEMRGYMK